MGKYTYNSKLMQKIKWESGLLEHKGSFEKKKEKASIFGEMV
jgi:hypothetical protein